MQFKYHAIPNLNSINIANNALNIVYFGKKEPLAVYIPPKLCLPDNLKSNHDFKEEEVGAEGGKIF